MTPEEIAQLITEEIAHIDNAIRALGGTMASYIKESLATQKQIEDLEVARATLAKLQDRLRAVEEMEPEANHKPNKIAKA